MDTTRMVRVLWALLALVMAAGTLATCGDDDDTSGSEAVIDPGDEGEYAPDIDPANYVDQIDNPYLPLLPGTQWVYEGVNEDGETERIEVVVTTERREVMGVSAVVVQDTVYEDGELVEDTFDWFAQDVDGNVWYLGEDSGEYEDGELVSTEGSREAGIDGALPGNVMLADPTVGAAYRQEYNEDEAEDKGEVSQVGVSQTVIAGEYDDIVVIREWNPLEPDVVEDKYHAPGVGVVLEQKVAGEEGRVELIEFTPAA